jgi:Tfp pilus assembly protein PilN
MNALHIDFVPRRRFASWLGLLLFAAGLGAVSVAAIDYLDASDELERVELKQARQQRPDAGARPRAKTASAPRDDTQAIDRVTAQLQLPWDALLHELETRTGPAVALLDIEAQGQTRTLRITGEAKTMADIVAYLGQLRESELIEAANLSHHEEKLVAAVSIIRFSLDASWKAPL